MMMMKIKMVTHRFIVDVPREKRRVADEDDADEDDADGGPPICGMDTHGMCHRCPK